MLPAAYGQTRALRSTVIRDVLPSAQREYSRRAVAGAFQSLLDRFRAAGLLASNRRLLLSLLLLLSLISLL
jgi:hypothetical protein